MAGRLADRLALLLRAGALAAAASRLVIHHLVDRSRGQQLSAPGRDAPAGHPACARRGRSLALGRPGRVLARRRRRVWRVAVQAARELGDSLVLAGLPLGPLHAIRGERLSAAFAAMPTPGMMTGRGQGSGVVRG